MNPITLPNQPATGNPRTAVFEFVHEGIYSRVILNLKDSLVDGHIEMQAQAYQMTQQGEFVQAPNGYPSRTPSSTHTINTSGIAAKSATLGPGWIRTLPEASTQVDAEHLPEGTTIVDTLPATALPGDLVYLDPYLYKWDEGIAVATAKVKTEELVTIVANSAPLSGLGFSFE